MKPSVRWGIIGTGTIARHLASDFPYAPGAQLVAVGSRDAARAQRFAAEHGDVRAHGSYEAIIHDAAIDVLYIATTNESHRDLAIAAMEAGKGVLCEKPFTLTGAEARAVQEAAHRTGMFCMEAMWMRFSPDFQAMLSRCRDGSIGEVQEVRASLGFHVPFDPHHRIYDPALGGGALLDLGVYAVSCCSAILGAPRSVRASAHVGASGVDEHTTITFEYPSGARATVVTSVQRELDNDAVITGSRRRLHLQAPLYFPGAFSRTEGRGYQFQVREVMQCMADGRKESTVMPLDESVRIMEMMDAAAAAWRQ